MGEVGEEEVVSVVGVAVVESGDWLSVGMRLDSGVDEVWLSAGIVLESDGDVGVVVGEFDVGSDVYGEELMEELVGEEICWLEVDEEVEEGLVGKSEVFGCWEWVDGTEGFIGCGDCMEVELVLEGDEVLFGEGDFLL